MQNNNINYLLNYEMIKMQGNFSGLAGNFHGKAVSVIKNELDKFANNL